MSGKRRRGEGEGARRGINSSASPSINASKPPLHLRHACPTSRLDASSTVARCGCAGQWPCCIAPLSLDPPTCCESTGHAHVTLSSCGPAIGNDLASNRSRLTPAKRSGSSTGPTPGGCGRGGCGDCQDVDMNSNWLPGAFRLLSAWLLTYREWHVTGSNASWPLDSAGDLPCRACSCSVPSIAKLSSALLARYVIRALAGLLRPREVGRMSER